MTIMTLFWALLGWKFVGDGDYAYSYDNYE